MSMGFMNESGDSDPFPGDAGDGKSPEASAPQKGAAAAGSGDPPSDTPSSDVTNDTERAARERLRIIRERIARGFYDRPGIKAKLAERMIECEEFAQTWRDADRESSSPANDDINPPQTDSGAEDSEEQTSENI